MVVMVVIMHMVMIRTRTLGSNPRHDTVSHGNRTRYMVAHMIGAEHLYYTGMVEHLAHALIHARQYHMYTLLLRRLDQNLKVMHTCGIDKRNTAHTYYTHQRLTLHGGAHQLVELRGDAEEERTVETPSATSSTSCVVASEPSATSSCPL